MFKLKVHSNKEKNIDNIEIYIERYIYRGIYAWYVRLDGYIVYIYSWVYLGGWKEVFVFYHIYREAYRKPEGEFTCSRKHNGNQNYNENDIVIFFIFFFF